MEPGKIDWAEFLECERGLLIAPAGHGKTTAISDCLNLCPDDSCQLVLTHTHAGIASLKKKFKAKSVPSHKYKLETITGFAQRYVLAFLGASVLPKQEEKHYFREAVVKCTEILNTPVLQHVIKLSYNGVFVDEYQDCTISQHDMVMALSQNLPLHILGDPLQGIFDFERERLVNFDTDLPEMFFRRFVLLDTPWRWKDTNIGLGNAILNWRNILESETKELKLVSCREREIFVAIAPNHKDEFDGDFIKWRNYVISSHASDSTLILCPSYLGYDAHGNKLMRGDLDDRLRFKQCFDFSHHYLLLDALDGETYYQRSKKIDDYLKLCLGNNKADKLLHLCKLMESLYIGKSFIKDWITHKGKGTPYYFISKADKVKKVASSKVEQCFNSYLESPTISSLRTVLLAVAELPGYKNSRYDFMNDIIRCMSRAIEEDISAYESMSHQRSQIRHMGRKIEGKCIGTTLLTKGLEFDTVILLNADKFQDKKHFYVAVSRAKTRLVFITDSATIKFK